MQIPGEVKRPAAKALKGNAVKDFFPAKYKPDAQASVSAALEKLTRLRVGLVLTHFACIKVLHGVA